VSRRKEERVRPVRLGSLRFPKGKKIPEGVNVEKNYKRAGKQTGGHRLAIVQKARAIEREPPQEEKGAKNKKHRVIQNFPAEGPRERKETVFTGGSGDPWNSREEGEGQLRGSLVRCKSTPLCKKQPQACLRGPETNSKKASSWSPEAGQKSISLRSLHGEEY